MSKLQQIFSDNWCVRHREYNNLMALLLPAVISGNIDKAAEHIGESVFKASATGGTYMARWWELDDLNLPADSVCVIKLRGMLYSWDSEKLVEIMNAIESNPNICGTVLEIDGPGGMVSHADQAAEAVRKSSKPTATLVTGLMASAHYWIGSGADRIFLASPLCEVGSVGIMTTYCSIKQMLKEAGIDYREIYPDSSDLKNLDFRMIEEKDDESLVKERMERVCRIFCETVAENLGIAYDPKLPIFRGEMFLADDAISAGFAHEFGNLDDAVTWVLAQSTIKKINH